MDNNISVQVGVGLKPNEVRRAIVKSVSYEESEGSSIGLRKIQMETEDGMKADWSISSYCHLHLEEFIQTQADILAGRITKGTEVTIEYNPNGIMCFYLEES